MKLNLKNVRGAFLQNIFEAGTVNGEGEPAFSGAWLIDPSTADGKANIAAAEAAEKSVADEKWGAKAASVLKQIVAQGKNLIQDGAKKETYAGYAGNMFINSRSKVRPLVIDRQKNPLTAADGVVYSGAYYNVQLEIWAQDNSYGKRINAQLKGVQFVRDGDAFSGGGTPANADEFDDLGDTGEGEGEDLGELA